VCAHGGWIGLANWTPTGFIGQVFRTIGKHLPPPAVKSPALWGTRERIAELFEQEATSVATTTRHFAFRYRSPAHWLHAFKTYYGPMLKAFTALDADAQLSLESDLIELVARFNRSGDESMVVPSEYLEVVITRS
jgi:hypothetical protein